MVRDRSGGVIGAVETFRLITHLEEPQNVSPAQYSFSAIIGRSQSMQRFFRILPDVAASDANVLIQGESGTGKELVARAIHHHSPFGKGRLWP